MNKTILTLGILVVLSACSLPNRQAPLNINLDTIPTQTDVLSNHADMARYKMKATKEHKIVYFDKNGVVQNSPQVGGFYRQLLGYNAAGQAIVQDFYQDNQAKQTNPMILADSKNFDNFDSASMQGRVIWYSPAGKITQFLDYENGLVQRGAYYNDAGIRVLETEGDNHLNPDAPVKVRGYYDNGKLFFENSQVADESQSVFYYDNGQKMWHGVSQSDTIHAWKRNGRPTELVDIADEVASAEKRATEMIKQFINPQ